MLCVWITCIFVCLYANNKAVSLVTSKTAIASPLLKDIMKWFSIKAIILKAAGSADKFLDVSDISVCVQCDLQSLSLALCVYVCVFACINESGKLI